MASKKKPAKKSARTSKGKSGKKKSRKIARRAASTKKVATKRVSAKKPAKKKSRKAAAAKATARTSPAKMRVIAKKAPAPRKKAPGRASLPFSVERPEPRSGRMSGDLQGLSSVAGADSESVDELLEEGNSFEAGVVSGVEDSGDDVKEVRTRQVPEDDVPEEYLDEE